MSENPAHAAGRSRSGIRFSRCDAVIIATCALATWWLWAPLGSLVVLLPGVLLQYFLFCNVFRVRTRYELMWAAAFLLNATAWQLTHEISWQRLLGSQLVVTALVIGAELRSPAYHGIGHRWINPSGSADDANPRAAR